MRLKGRQGRAVKETPTSEGGLEDKLGRGRGESLGGGSGEHPPCGWGVVHGSVCPEYPILYSSTRLCLAAQ